MTKSLYLALLLLPLLAIANNDFYAMDNALSDVRALEDKATLLKELGYDGITWRPGDTAKAVAAMQQHNIKLQAFMMTMAVAPEGKGSELPLAEIQALKDTGAILWVQLRRGAGKDADAIRELQRLNAVAQPLGLRIAIYPHIGNHAETLEDALRIANSANDPNIGVSLTLCHQLKKMGVQDLAPLLKTALPKLFLVQLSGAEAGNTKTMSWGQLIQPLGAGNYDLKPILATLRELNYDGPVGVIGYKIKQPAKQHLAQSIAFWEDNQPK